MSLGGCIPLGEEKRIPNSERVLAVAYLFGVKRESPSSKRVLTV